MNQLANTKAANHLFIYNAEVMVDFGSAGK